MAPHSTAQHCCHACSRSRMIVLVRTCHTTSKLQHFNGACWCPPLVVKFACSAWLSFTMVGNLCLYPKAVQSSSVLCYREHAVLVNACQTCCQPTSGRGETLRCLQANSSLSLSLNRPQGFSLKHAYLNFAASLQSLSNILSRRLSHNFAVRNCSALQEFQMSHCLSTQARHDPYCTNTVNKLCTHVLVASRH